MNDRPSGRSRGVALALCIPLGVFGAHRFYTGKTGSGILMAVTIGGLGLWWLYDVIMIGSGEFRDDEGRRLSLWDPHSYDLESGQVPEHLLDEVELLRREVAELAERLDFTERMLANPGRQTSGREGGGSGSG